MSSRGFCIVLVVLNVLIYANCARILGVFPAPGYSQFILGEALMLELANRGHEVSVISQFEPTTKTENYRTISVQRDGEADLDLDLFALEQGYLFSNILSTYELGYYIAETTLQSPAVQKLLKSDENFDVVIVEKFFSESLEGLALYFKAPLILFSSMGPCEFNTGIMGVPFMPSINTLTWTPYTRHMTYHQRFINTIATIYDALYKNFVSYPHHQRIIDKYFPKSVDLSEAIYNASLMLLNSHVAISESAPIISGMVEIGGFHIKETPLEPDVKKYLDEATDGAILFSLGSNLKSSELSNDTIKTILATFKRFKQRFLWKFETDLPNKPDNVLISKWLKQPDILAHPNVQLFITHGGLLSTTEAVFYGVPIVGIPFFGDQKMNIARVKRGQYGTHLAFKDLSDEERFFAVINETIYNPKYQENVRFRSNLMRDNVVRPLDLAMYWIEYVIRHRGYRFKPPALDLYWYQLYMIDLVAIPIFCVIIAIYSIRKFTFKKCNHVAGKPTKNKKQKKH